MNRKTACSLAAALFFFAVLVRVCQAVLAGATFVEVLIELDHPDRLQVYYSSGGPFTEAHSFSSGLIAPGGIQTVRIPLHQMPVQKIRLDLGQQSGNMRLHRLTVAGYFAQTAVLGPTEIARLFRADASGTLLRLEQGVLEMQTHEDSYLVCGTPLLLPKPFLLWGIPLLFALFLFLLLRQTDLASLPPFADLRGKQPSSGDNIDALDGLRAFALLLVVADHTWGFFSGAGRSGVWIFMTLSGFLLAKPFVQQPERILSPSFLSHFFLRRIKRILPVYYTYIAAVFLLHGRLEEAALHFLFLKGSGHLWVVPQEICFYLLTPPALLLCLLLFRLRPWLVPPGLLGLIILACRHADAVRLRGGLDEPQPLFFGVFLIGMLASWMYYSLGQRQDLPFRRWTCGSRAAAPALLIMLAFALFSHEREWGGSRFLALIYYPWFAAAAAALILAVLETGGSPLLRPLSSLPLRALSLVSFSMYLLHPLTIDLLGKGARLYLGVERLSSVELFISVLLLTYLASCFSYSLIERPFLRSV